MQWLYLALAIFFECSWAIAMKASAGFTKPFYGALAFVLSLFSLGFLGLATKTLELSIAYAMWTGMGAALVALAGVLWFREPLSAAKAVSLALIVLGVAGLQIGRTGP